MADLKISQLTGASTPLAGTEVLPIVQSGSTVKVSVANLTAGRAVASAGGTFSDNFVQGVAAKGINFTANTPAAGMTSQLLNWYEEGTWTPALTSASGTVTVVDATQSVYTRVGRIVHVYGRIGMTTNASVGTSDLTISGLPFAAANRGFGNLILSNFSANDYGTGGAHGLVYVESSAIYHIVRTVDISSRGSTFYWAYSATYAV